MLCNLNVAPDAIRINGVSVAGVSGDVGLALIKWQAVGSVASSTTLTADVQRLGELDEPPINHTTQDQVVKITAMGDVDCDGIIGAVDTLLILRYDIGALTSTAQCPPRPGTIYLPACDVDADGVCGSVDALLISRCDVGFPNPFCPADTNIEDELGARRYVVGSEGAITQQESATLCIEHPEQVDNGETFTVTVKAEVEPEAKMGAVTANVGYDMNQFDYVSCQTSDQKGVTSGGCNPDGGDGKDNRITFNAIMPEGFSGSLNLAEITFTHQIGTAMNTDRINLKKHTFTDLDGQRFDVTICGNTYFAHLPMIIR